MWDPSFKWAFLTSCLSLNLHWFYKYFYKFWENILSRRKKKDKVEALESIRALLLLILDFFADFLILASSF